MAIAAAAAMAAARNPVVPRRDHVAERRMAVDDFTSLFPSGCCRADALLVRQVRQAILHTGERGPQRNLGRTEGNDLPRDYCSIFNQCWPHG
jgi:hypothetical protein